MMGPLYNQVMRSRMGLGGQFEGYGGFTPQSQPAQMQPSPSPWMHSLPANQGGVVPPQNPWGSMGSGSAYGAGSPGISGGVGLGGVISAPEGGRRPVDPMGPVGHGGPVASEGSHSPSLPMQTPRSQSGVDFMGGGMRNPWQRY